MKTQHTPGPWFVSKEYTNTIVGDCLAIAQTLRNEQQEANARLIAAAPEMLALLKATAHLIMGDSNYTILRRDIIEAIAKAEGNDYV